MAPISLRAVVFRHVPRRAFDDFVCDGSIGHVQEERTQDVAGQAHP